MITKIKKGDIILGHQVFWVGKGHFVASSLGSAICCDYDDKGDYFNCRLGKLEDMFALYEKFEAEEECQNDNQKQSQN